jgi:hypothetical protein
MKRLLVLAALVAAGPALAQATQPKPPEVDAQAVVDYWRSKADQSAGEAATAMGALSAAQRHVQQLTAELEAAKKAAPVAGPQAH